MPGVSFAPDSRAVNLMVWASAEADPTSSARAAAPAKDSTRRIVSSFARANTFGAARDTSRIRAKRDILECLRKARRVGLMECQSYA